MNPDHKKKRAAATGARFIPYPAVEHHGVIGDRRTAALVAADGTLDWLCLPDYDGAIVFGGLLDCSRGGHWKLGPVKMLTGIQRYVERSAVLQTEWTLPEGQLILTDAMLWPHNTRPPGREGSRVLVRRLRCTRGKVRGVLDFQPRHMFEKRNISVAVASTGVHVKLRNLAIDLWSTAPVEPLQSGARAMFELQVGQEVWAVMGLALSDANWTIERAEETMQDTLRYWREWVNGLNDHGPRQLQMERGAITLHLLTYGCLGSQVAAATTSLPESVGGTWNADYRFSWVRDTSLACAALVWLGDWHETERYLQWLTSLAAPGAMPFQVLYGIHGETEPKQRIVKAASGYRDSRPVRVGNHAYKQIQMSSLGFLADCALIYLNGGGVWTKNYGDIIERIADYALKHWHQRDNSIWELSEKRHYVSSKVMGWVVLDRAIKIMRITALETRTDHWEKARCAIRDDVLAKGWSDRLGSFRQHYEAENLDAAALLIPIMDFLPADDPRVLKTIDRIAEDLTIDDFVFRFNPQRTRGVSKLPLGQLEGAFLPCTFWLATAYAKTRRPQRALAILQRAEAIAGELGLFAEAVDPRTRGFTGNTPLLFSHVEYLRAVLALGEAAVKRQDRLR
ncbi:MAG TPA: glycoside hydrolase family 15 protein [Candidatus Binatia bacterium]